MGVTPAPWPIGLPSSLVVTTGVKFLLADLLSKDGFDVEKTVADVALALSAAFFSLALGLQFGPARPDVGTNLVFAASVTFHDKLLHSSATPLVKAQQAIWLIAVGSLLSVAVTTWLAWNARTIREKQATIPPWRLSLYRGSSVLLGALTYAIYFVLLLYRP